MVSSLSLDIARTLCISEARSDGLPMPECGGDGERLLSTYTHGKGTAKVIENDPRAGVASVIHG
jgi:hypothetical protein